MRGLTLSRGMALAGLGVALALAAFWFLGGFALVERLAATAQRGLQEAMAGSLRAIRAGEAGAIAGLLALCFGYGFVHAAGPGHGKFLIGSYGVARRVGFLPLAGIAIAASLAQAGVAVGLVLLAFGILGWTRAEVLGAGEGGIVVAGHLLVLGIGLWLVWRGLRSFVPRQHRAHHHHHHHHQGEACDCGHSHGPTPVEIERVTGWRDTLLLVGGVAIRPCSGALLLLVLTVQMGLTAAGIAGAFAMGLGVSFVTVLVAALAVWGREGAFAAWPNVPRWLSPALQVIVGVLVASVALDLIVA